MPIPMGSSSPPPVKPLAPERMEPELESFATLLPKKLGIQTFPKLSIAMPSGKSMPPPVKLSPMVKSLCAALNAGWKGALPVCNPKSAAMFTPGLCAMLIAATAVSVGVLPLFFALLKSVSQAVEVDPVELMQAARTLASELISLCGTVPLPAGVVARAVPVLRVSRFVTVANALAMPVCANELPELETCNA